MKAGSISRFGSRLHLAILLILTLQFTLSGRAQTTTGSIYGTVTDAGGAVIPNAPVVATDTKTGIAQTTISNQSGDYIFAALNPGDYKVSTSVAGFQSMVQREISLSANQNIHVSFALAVGHVDQTVDVEATTTMVDTRESQLGETIDQRNIQELPLNGRNVYDLVTILPGVTGYTADTATGSRNGTAISVNDLTLDSGSFYLDGAFDIAFRGNSGNLLPNPDALQEFRLLTSNFDAEFGRGPGAVVNVITRGGTSKFHGMGYEYLRNDAFNASSRFTTKTPLKQNQFGGNVGGPLLPNSRAFFFLSYERLQVHTAAKVGATQIVTATAAERTGNFTNSLPAVKASLNSTFAGLTCGQQYVICSTNLDPVAQNLLAFVPVETITSTAPVVESTTEQDATANIISNQGLARIDFRLTPAHQLEALYFNSRGTSQSPNIGANRILSYAGMLNYENTVNAVLADTWTISPKAVNNLRGFYTQNLYVIGNTFDNHTLQSLGSHASAGGVYAAPPSFAITGYWTMGTDQSGPSNISQLSFGLSDTANLTRGHHEIKLGGAYIWSHYQETGGLESNGIFTFTGATTGNALADFLAGKANKLTQTSTIIHRMHNFDPSLFAQDDWQITRSLNLNLGLRWEVYAPFLGDPTLATFAPNVQSKVIPSAPVGLLFLGDQGVPDGVYSTSYKKFAPRVGFAYDLFGNGQTSLRGGYGVFYQEVIVGNTSNLQQQPFTASVSISQLRGLVDPYCTVPSPCTGTDPFPFVYNAAHPNFVTGTPSTITGVPVGGGSIPYVMEYNLTLEQQLGKRWGMHIAYVGNGARKFPITHDINAPNYVAGAAVTTAGLTARRPYEPATTPAGFVYGTINIYDDALNSRYNSLQTTLHGRIGSRLNVMANYVWSKGISYEGAVVDGHDLKKNRGLSTLDIRNKFAASALYSLPDVRFLGLFGKEVLSGWQTNAVVQLQSGTPFTVISGTDTNLDGVTNDRADVVGNPYNTKAHSRADKIQKYLDPAGFAAPKGPYGNEQRNSIIGPHSTNTNLSVFKMFPIHEDMKLQFRTEAFNAFNTVNLGNPVANLKTLTAGAAQISTAGNPRVVQFALKLLF